MKKFCFVVLSIILLMATPSFAQTPNENTRSEGKTGFTCIAISGMSRDSGRIQGIPGYIEMTDPDGSRFYIFVDSNGYLRIASAATAGTTDAAGDPPTSTTDWTELGDKVGSQ